MSTASVEAQIESQSVGMADCRNSTKPQITDPSALNAERVTKHIGELRISGFVSRDSSVANFRNVPYADIPGRWHEARMLDPTIQAGCIDATQWGPRCPQLLNVPHLDTGHLYPRMSIYDRQSEFECLNLNIYSPMQCLDSETDSKGCPVLVWIHGGSFEFGDGGCESDGQYLVEQSIKCGQPIIVVGINYRLGALGFLSSKELRDEARSRGETGYSNLGFADQRLALQWVAKYISHFGGDGDRITLAGESAGAISVLAHLRGNIPVCHNALIMSAGSVVPISQSITQLAYDKLVDAVGMSDAPAAAKLAALRSLPADKIQQLSTDRTETILSEDPEFFTDYQGQRFEELREMPPWLKRLVVGDLKEESAAMIPWWRKVPDDSLLNTWKQLYGNHQGYAEEVFAAYGMDTAADRSNEKVDVPEKLSDYTGDALFSFATSSIARSHLVRDREKDEAPTKVYQYRFDQPDIVALGPGHKSRVYHSMDNAFLFCHPAVAGAGAPEEFISTSSDFSGSILRMMYDQDPWENIEKSNQFRIFHGNKGRMVDQREGYASRWAKLADTPERRDQFLLGKDLLWKTIALAMEKSEDQ